MVALFANMLDPKCHQYTGNGLPPTFWKRMGVFNNKLEETNAVFTTRILEMNLRMFSSRRLRYFLPKLNTCLSPRYWKELRLVGFDEEEQTHWGRFRFMEMITTLGKV